MLNALSRTADFGGKREHRGTSSTTSTNRWTLTLADTPSLSAVAPS